MHGRDSGRTEGEKEERQGDKGRKDLQAPTHGWCGPPPKDPRTVVTHQGDLMVHGVEQPPSLMVTQRESLGHRLAGS